MQRRIQPQESNEAFKPVWNTNWFDASFLFSKSKGDLNHATQNFKDVSHWLRYHAGISGNILGITTLYRISSEIREQDLSIMRSVFDNELKSQIEKKRQVQPENPFDYSLFKNTGDNLNARFKRYFFARVEGFC